MTPKQCTHFNGIQNGTCKAGVDYRTVRDKSKRPYGFPCLATGGYCARYQTVTAEEIAAHKAIIEDSLECMQRGISRCCRAQLDTSRVITDGRHKGHGPRFCSKCGQLCWIA